MGREDNKRANTIQQFCPAARGLLVECRRTSADGYGPLGVVFGVGGGSGRGESRRPSPQSPKGILGASPPFGDIVRTPLAKRKVLKQIHLRNCGRVKKPCPQENFPPRMSIQVSVFRAQTCLMQKFAAA